MTPKYYGNTTASISQYRIIWHIASAPGGSGKG